MLNPRKSPKNPPQLEMKSNAVILGIFSYSKENYENSDVPILTHSPIAVADP